MGELRRTVATAALRCLAKAAREPTNSETLIGLLHLFAGDIDDISSPFHIGCVVWKVVLSWYSLCPGFAVG